MQWMAWTLPTAIFFASIATVLIIFTVLAIRFPETPRHGVLGMETTRGDRLFIALLAAAFLNLAWLGLTDLSQWWGLLISLVVAIPIFRWV
ncbi:DUF2160 domain-containing protein [Notoacmeibacter sp. MSK16QG-6]|uniref:DUF2160 domain-containing protein n=1 Tax=Notoacmeibacter sp. MSK16QG-6 TaxID=2957982 RepID=UPI00209CDC64|nr:DUF2160 family membrane protein [Notoacmeibacter sp. MSK16QG-6]MCP1199803.1 DUF2160 domain-containing protein [Notoacmeibacter sp. MSK16QG-6]